MGRLVRFEITRGDVFSGKLKAKEKPSFTLPQSPMLPDYITAAITSRTDFCLINLLRLFF